MSASDGGCFVLRRNIPAGIGAPYHVEIFTGVERWVVFGFGVDGMHDLVEDIEGG